MAHRDDHVTPDHPRIAAIGALGPTRSGRTTPVGTHQLGLIDIKTRGVFENHPVGAEHLEVDPVVSIAMKCVGAKNQRSEEHTSELQSLRRISYAVFCLKKK